MRPSAGVPGDANRSSSWYETTPFSNTRMLCPDMRDDIDPLPPPARLPQRAYIWQRDWRAPIAESLREGRDSLDGCAVLAAEIEWDHGQPHVVRPDVNWAALRQWGKPVGAAMRISPFAGPFHE